MQKLSKVQREVLEIMRDGSLLFYDRTDSRTWLQRGKMADGTFSVHFNTFFSLKRRGYITKQDSKKWYREDYRITEPGREALNV